MTVKHNCNSIGLDTCSEHNNTYKNWEMIYIFDVKLFF